MSHDIFVSYSAKDKAVADAVVAALESEALRCWMAPRDVLPGSVWGEAIVNAIESSRIMVLILSGDSNRSRQVLREVEQAVGNEVIILPFRIEAIDPTGAMSYYLATEHWLDALTPPIERHVERLTASIQALLSGDPSTVRSRQPLAPPPQPRLQLRRLLVITGLALAALATTGILVATLSGSNSDTPILAMVGDGPETTTTTGATNVTTTTTITTSGPGPQSTTIDGRALSFMIPDPQLWVVSGDERFTAVEQSSADAFAWSTEIFEGDLTVQFDVESPGVESSGCLIVYGGGFAHSYGSLIFCVEWDVFSLEKHTTYHSGENFVTYSPSHISFSGEVYQVEIVIESDAATMFVNGQKVLSTVLDLEEIERRGRIGLHKKYWINPEVTFSNINISALTAGGQDVAAPEDDGFDCELDTGSNLNYYSIESPYVAHAIEIDGGITSPAEWALAQCVDVRSHYTINVANPDFRRTRWWVQNNGEDIFFLVRVPREFGLRGVFVDYFWPEYVGTWAHSDGVYVTVDGETFDRGRWDELQWYEDSEMDPPGTVDATTAVGEDAEFHWLEIQRPLNSGDAYDWIFEPGQRYGNNPYDSVMIGIEADDGWFLRYLQLDVGEP